MIKKPIKPKKIKIQKPVDEQVLKQRELEKKQKEELQKSRLLMQNKLKAEKEQQRRQAYEAKCGRAKQKEKQRAELALKKNNRRKEMLARFTDKEHMPFCSALKLSVDGFNQARLLSELSADGVAVLYVKRQSASAMSIVIKKKDSEKAFAILRRLCYNYRVQSESGTKRFLFLTARRAGAIVAAVVLCAVIALSQTFVWRIEIEGNERVPLSQIQAVLKNNGVNSGSKKNRIDLKALKNSIDLLDGILESTVSLKGNTVRIVVVESTVTTPENPSQKGEIISEFDAVITSIEAESGTPLVKVGSVVKKGDALIAPYVLDPDGNKRPEVAKGRVYGSVTRTKSTVFTLDKYKKNLTGKSYTYTVLGYKKLEIKGKNKMNFALYDAETSVVKPFSFLPLFVRQTRYTETSITVEKTDRETKVAEILNECLPELKAGLVGALENSHSVAELGGECYRLDMFVTCNKILIGEAKNS